MLPSQRDGCLLVRHSPLGYDGSIAYPWCPHYGGIGIQLPWRCRTFLRPDPLRPQTHPVVRFPEKGTRFK